ncbi:MAG: aminotransferase class V-fold PLP-dependent enzyme, partial [Myxococcota bacterium]
AQQSQQQERQRVDGAHAPGQVPLHLDDIEAAYYTGNCHKWMFAPKGAAFLYAREDLRTSLRPLVISHGANTPVGSSSRLHLEFDWTGTADFTPLLALPAAIEFGASLFEGGFSMLMEQNRRLALTAKVLLEERLAVTNVVPEEFVGSMAAVCLPDGDGVREPGSRALDPLQDSLWSEFGIEVPIVPFPAWPQRLVRVSAQAYNGVTEYQRLADALASLIGVPASA